jgi:hypothetical protein
MNENNETWKKTLLKWNGNLLFEKQSRFDACDQAKK